MKLTSENIAIFSQCISFKKDESAIFNVDIYIKNNDVDILKKHTTCEKIGHANVILNLKNGLSSTDLEISNCEFDPKEITRFITNKCFERCKALMD